MKSIIFTLTLVFSTILSYGQNKDTIIYKLLKCGLYLGSNGDIGYRTEEIYNDNFDKRLRYITWVWGVEAGDSVNGGLKEMKFVIDTSSFQFLNYLYWTDKNNVYVFTPMSDGGTVCLNDSADRKTFIVLGDAGYAKDKKNVYYRGSKIIGADIKTFIVVKNKEIPELACDKLYFYQIGRRMTDGEIKELGLNNYKRQPAANSKQAPHR